MTSLKSKMRIIRPSMKGLGFYERPLNPVLCFEYDNVKEAVFLFDSLLKNDLLSNAECGNDNPTPATWNNYIKRQRQRIKEIFGDFEK